MTTIYLVRHAEAEGNLYRRIHGRYDSLVTDRGMLQIAALRRRFEGVHIDAVYSSDMTRTMTTARSVYEPRGLKLQTLPELREVNMGCWEDRTWGEVGREQPEELIRFNQDPVHWCIDGCEAFLDAGERIHEAVLALARKHEGETIALFSHGSVIRSLLCRVMNVDPAQPEATGFSDNTAVSQFVFENGRLDVVSRNDNSHLDESLSTLSGQKWWRRGYSLKDSNFWYRPLTGQAAKDYQAACRRDLWRSLYGDDSDLDTELYWQEALTRGDLFFEVLLREERAGLIQLSPASVKDGAGNIPFYYLEADYRNRGLGVQLIGQAISHYRPLGCQRLQLMVSERNPDAKRFYEKYGFRQIGEEQGAHCRLFRMEKDISYPEF